MRHFKREFYLAGGTALALQVGHRRSIDFDLFKISNLNTAKILKKINAAEIPYIVTRRVSEQINLVMKTVKITFFQYPYAVETSVDFEKTFRIPDMLTLAAMKAYALGRRSKWKDYVDLYYLLRDHYTLDQIVKKADLLYGQMFSGKLFRSQLAFHKDIDYSEPVEYMPGFEINSQDVKNLLIDKSLQVI
jgi:hypothetical protein